MSYGSKVLKDSQIQQSRWIGATAVIRPHKTCASKMSVRTIKEQSFSNSKDILTVMLGVKI